MSLHEYAVNMDFFTSDPDNHFGFPCCVCKNRHKRLTEYPCKYCGHNDSAIESFQCFLCDEIVDDNPYEDGKTIAEGTPAEMKRVCETYYDTILDEVKQ